MTSHNDTIRVGEARITKITEHALTAVSAANLYPDWHAEAIAPHANALVPTDLDADLTQLNESIHSWLVRTPRHTMLVDPAGGNDKVRPDNPLFDRQQTAYLERLAAAGTRPEEVDYVLITHLHVDHVGWNTRWVDQCWVPTFPNAQYIFSGVEYDYYAEPEHIEPPSRGIFEDSVQPIVDAGLARLIEPDGREAIDGVAFLNTPGHSYAHNSIMLTSNDERAFFGGDVMHTPVQVYRPDWNSVFCEADEPARASRRWALEYAARRKALYLSTHFAGTSAGSVTAHADGYAWRYHESRTGARND